MKNDRVYFPSPIFALPYDSVGFRDDRGEARLIIVTKPVAQLVTGAVRDHTGTWKLVMENYRGTE